MYSSSKPSRSPLGDGKKGERNGGTPEKSNLADFHRRKEREGKDRKRSIPLILL